MNIDRRSLIKGLFGLFGCLMTGTPLPNPVQAKDLHEISKPSEARGTLVKLKQYSVGFDVDHVGFNPCHLKELSGQMRETMDKIAREQFLAATTLDNNGGSASTSKKRKSRKRKSRHV